jgi:DNA (cytosine-5)-methyltransferase 1
MVENGICSGMINVGSDFSGVGAFNQALQRLGINYNEVFACDMDKYARKTFIHNYGQPGYYPENVYNREIPKKSLDIYMTSPPCQAFSLAGKRKGKEDLRGVLFFNSHEFIQENKPRYFIFENVKGLLSDDNGNTFQEWINYLGGKSVNGAPTIFPTDEAVPYHIYWKVLNAKNYNVPQNRERVFIIGIRDDEDNHFTWPKEVHLIKRLKDMLDNDVDDKYFLSEKNIENLINYNERQVENNRGFSAKFRDVENIEIMDALKCGGGGKDDLIKIGTWRTHKDGQGFREIEDGNCPTIPARAREDGSGQPVVMQLNPSLESGGKQPYQQNRIYDSNALCPALNAGQQTWGGNIVTLPNDSKIRRLTPRECFRLMDFPDTFDFSVVSDSQAYKQAGNSIVVKCLELIINKFNF